MGLLRLHQVAGAFHREREGEGVHVEFGYVGAQ